MKSELRLFSMALCLVMSMSGCTSLDFSQIPRLGDTVKNAIASAPADAASVNTTNPEYSDDNGRPIYTLTEFELTQPWEGGELRFRIQDTIQMSVWGYPELDHIAEVQANGFVTLPLIGEVEANGRTVSQVRDDVRGLLQAHGKPSSTTLRFGDLVKLFVWNHPDLAYEAIVQPNGTVTLPLIGQIEVTGRALDDLNSEIRKRLSSHVVEPQAWLIVELQARKVLHDPKVSILPAKLSPRRVALIGEVEVNGQQDLQPGMRILNLLANARPMENAALDSVIVIRNTETSSPKYRKLDLKAYLEGRSPLQNIQLQEGDLVIVPRTTIAQVAHFIDMFFVRTKPIFDWYIAAQLTYRYDEVYRLNRSLNEAARDAFRDSTVNPSLP